MFGNSTIVITSDGFRSAADTRKAKFRLEGINDLKQPVDLESFTGSVSCFISKRIIYAYLSLRYPDTPPG